MSGLKISRANQNQISTWKNLAAYRGWKAVAELLDRRIEDADLVINQIGADRECEYTKRDIAIIKKNEALFLKELPEKMVEMLSGTGEQETEEFDPFEEVDQIDQVEMESELEEDF